MTWLLSAIEWLLPLDAEMNMDLPVSSMSTAEKLDAMEQLWASLQTQSDHAPPDWHGQILAERQQRIDRGEVSFSTLDEVRQRIERNRN